MNLESKIEAVLFWKGEPMSFAKLADTLKVSKVDISEAVLRLKEQLHDRGIALVIKEDEVTLATVAELSSLFEELTKEELNKELSKSSLETLSIVLYKNGVSRSEIDYIRGVNSSFILRALSIRGLVEKITDPADSRRFIYKPSFELLSFMGVQSVEELPDYFEINAKVTAEAEKLATEVSGNQDL